MCRELHELEGILLSSPFAHCEHTADGERIEAVLDRVTRLLPLRQTM
jgi:hypothetical protein